MKLIIPPQFHKPCYRGKTFKALWMHQINIRYIKAQIRYGMNRMAPELVCLLTDEIIGFVDNRVHSLDYFEEPVDVLQKLHEENLHFIKSTVEEFIHKPDLLNSDIEIVNGIMRKKVRGFRVIDGGAFEEGEYQPEKLFTQGTNSEWSYYETTFDPTVRSAGNKYMRDDYPYNFNPYNIHGRHYAPLECSNTELTEIPEEYAN